jgi:lipopolysaccharide transport system permease protein
VSPLARLSGRSRLSAQLVWFEVRKHHAGTALGAVWVVLEPILLLSTFILMFALLRVPRHSPHGPSGELVMVFSGIVPWFFFVRMASRSVSVFPNYAGLVKQIDFPIGALPAVMVGVELINYLVGIGLLLAFTLALGWLSWPALMLVPATLVLTAFLLGLVAIMAPLGVMLGDIRMALPAILRLTLFVTPVLYLSRTLPPHLRAVAYANPVSYFIGTVRYAVFGTNDVTVLGPGLDLAVAFAIAVVTLTIAYLTRSSARRVVDYL